MIVGLFFNFLGAHPENLLQISQIARIIAKALARSVGNFGNRLTIGANHFDHNVERFRPQIVGEICADAET